MATEVARSMGRNIPNSPHNRLDTEDNAPPLLRRKTFDDSFIGPDGDVANNQHQGDTSPAPQRRG